MTRLLRALGLAVTAFAAAPAVAADPPAAAKPGQGPFVVMVGVGEYQDKAIQPRPTADADAKALYDLFADPRYLGVPADRRVLLTATPDAKRNGEAATRANIIKAVHDAVAKTGKDDLIVIGLFGRAAPSADKVAFFAADSTVKERAKDAVLGSDLGAELKGVKGQRICVLFDAHFRGFDAGKELMPEPTSAALLGWVFGTSAVEEKEGDTPPPQDKVILLSAIPSNDPLTKGDHGLFASAVLDALRGKADAEGYEADGLVTVDELAKYLDKEVPPEARRLGRTTKEKEAVPFVVGEEVSHFPLTHNPAASAEAAARLKAVAELGKSGKLTKELTEEGTALLTRMPKLKQQQELRKRYQELADGKLSVDAFEKARSGIKEAMKLPDDAADVFVRKVYLGLDSLKSRYIKVLNAGELTAGAVRGLYRRLAEPLPTDLEDELKRAKTLSEDRQKAILKDARLRLGKREDLDEDKDVELALAMMTASLDDPYTVYLDKESVKKAESSLRAQFTGIGIHIRRDLARDGLLVVAPIKDSPAYKAGLKAGDLIVEIRREVDPQGRPIENESDKVVSTRGMKTDKAVELILGKAGVPVTVVIEREGAKEPIPFTISRGRVSLETVLGVKRNEKDEWNFWLDEENKIGYVYVSQFGPRTFDDLKKAMTKLEDGKAKGVILDLRYNPGGLLPAALTISDMFIESGKLLEVRPRVGQREPYYAQPEDPRGIINRKFTKLPMAVLINGGSASASEIVSACLQDYGRAVIVGERSYGKGSVQTIERFDPTGGEFKMTTARYFPPLGNNIDKRSTSGKDEDEWGVTPTKGYEVKISREERTELAELLRDKELIQKTDPAKEKKPFKDKQLEAALDYLRGKGEGKAAKR
jgi:C-terminal peptidase prc